MDGERRGARRDSRGARPQSTRRCLRSTSVRLPSKSRRASRRRGRARKGVFAMKYMTTFLVLALAAGSLAGCDKARSTASVDTERDMKLTLAKPSPVTLRRGGIAPVALRITRLNVSGDVTADFDDLPSGVSLVEDDEKIIGNERTFNLKADADAKLTKDAVAHVTVKAKGGLSVTQPFEVSVLEQETGSGR
jgi:hypothetical protein